MGAWGRAGGCKGLKEKRGESAREWGMNGDGTGWPRSKADMGRRKISARRKTTAEQACGRQVNDQEQVSSDGNVE